MLSIKTFVFVFEALIFAIPKKLLLCHKERFSRLHAKEKTSMVSEREWLLNQVVKCLHLVEQKAVKN
jgi:hypothetical protein